MKPSKTEVVWDDIYMRRIVGFDLIRFLEYVCTYGIDGLYLFRARYIGRLLDEGGYHTTEGSDDLCPRAGLDLEGRDGIEHTDYLH